MSSVPEGRAANQPLSVLTFTPPIGAWFPRSLAEDALDLFPGQLGAAHRVRRERRQLPLLLWGGGRLDPVGDRGPVLDSGPAQRIDTQAELAPRIASMSITRPSTFTSREGGAGLPARRLIFMCVSRLSKAIRR